MLFKFAIWPICDYLCVGLTLDKMSDVDEQEQASASESSDEEQHGESCGFFEQLISLFE